MMKDFSPFFTKFLTGNLIPSLYEYRAGKAPHAILFIYLYSVHNQLLNIISKQVSLTEREISLIKE